MSEDRPAIPEGIKQEVRQRCAFGCVICGSPVYHYDHMVEFNVVKVHEAANITLLCPNHHQDKTSGRLPLEYVLERDASPLNASRETTAWKDVHYSSSEFLFSLGGIGLVSYPKEYGRGQIDGLNVDGGTVIGVRWDPTTEPLRLSLWMRLCDRNNKPFLEVRNGELRLSTVLWDITNEGTLLRVRDAPGKIRLEFDYSPSSFHVRRADFWSNGYHFLIDKNGILSVGGQIFHNFTVSRGACVLFKGDNRYMAPQPIAFDLGSHGRLGAGWPAAFALRPSLSR